MHILQIVLANSEMNIYIGVLYYTNIFDLGIYEQISSALLFVSFPWVLTAKELIYSKIIANLNIKCKPSIRPPPSLILIIDS